MLLQTENIRSAGPELTPRLFEKLSAYLTSELGIKLPSSKRIMLQGRLQKRLRQLHLRSFEDYHAYVFSPDGLDKEMIHLMDAVTTNKTDFFREPRHFEILVQTALPQLLQNGAMGLRRPLKVWSAGCSTGAEPYTIAMVLSDFAGRVEGFGFQILGTDICTRVLEIGRTAVYSEREAAAIPAAFRSKYLLRSKDRTRPLIRIVPELRRLVEFRRLNMMDSDYNMPNSLDIIMCRNVIIYFDRATQYKVLQKLCCCLKEGGYLFTGHSETLNGFSLPLRQITATVYCKNGKS
jgi:chemotaxis protein methyltransferase CheR